MTTTNTTTAADQTSIIRGDERPWIPIPGFGGTSIKVLVADETLKQVVFMFKFAPGTVLPRHRHHCHAISYTISGEWQYEEGVLPVGSLAYEPFGSEHVPSSRDGVEMITFLKSDTDQFIENFLPDGTVIPMDMNFFKMLHAMTPEQAAQFQIPGLG